MRLFLFRTHQDLQYTRLRKLQHARRAPDQNTDVSPRAHDRRRESSHLPADVFGPAGEWGGVGGVETVFPASEGSISPSVDS